MLFLTMLLMVKGHGVMLQYAVLLRGSQNLQRHSCTSFVCLVFFGILSSNRFQINLFSGQYEQEI